ncbi:MAG: beta-hydroxyacyl-ACP dehydratase [Hyphomicrobiaceae bacterium]|nr:beta-hydroxyacyl-ACP dehydratase [Hyphomicrobiaceae bacterium]
MHIDRFQLVDRVAALDLSTASLTAIACVPSEHSIFSGHFPGHPLMPGVLLTELMAQTCGFLLLSLNGFLRMPFLAELKEVGFRSFVLPGTALSCEARREHDGSGYAVMRAKVLRRGETKPVCDGTVLFRLMAFPDPTLQAHMHDRAREVGLVLDAEGVRLSLGTRS